MDNYCPVDITEKTRKLLKEYKNRTVRQKALHCRLKKSISFGSSVVRRKNYRGTGMVEEHEKLKVMGRESLMLGQEQLDLRYLEQLADRGTDPDTGVSSQICKRAVQRQNNRSYGTDGIPDPETGKRRDRKCERAERNSGRDGNATKTGDLCVL